ncbi:MAG: hypothetical protein DYG83_14390 [Candidatus Brocadia sp. AMX2]|nr:MAG: hypothetical protein EDM70_16120 [Candidatus Brocadia sp. AMX2]MBC6933591.1 hypothetical protein [Candidatus Brocadia sp.]MBL1170459.1 hypothetical protein [Candidatus Brocadia sp. AMX1]MCE7867980.1 hypothetical protein [Candidatus Brocadia sp. AMX2]MCQ3918714.1 hypothetical protein [Candidatus Brocadia sp.]
MESLGIKVILSSVCYKRCNELVLVIPLFCLLTSLANTRPYGKKYSGQDEQNPLYDALDIEPILPYYSVSDIYELWLPTLTQEKMKSSDLLDRIFVTYAIKRALNQDKEAINKLCSLFQDIAEKVAEKMAKKRGLKRHIDDIKQEARILLWSMIKGFSPKQILDGLTHNVNFSIPNPHFSQRVICNIKRFQNT